MKAELSASSLAFAGPIATEFQHGYIDLEPLADCLLENNIA
jgi:hypothetical protein